MRRRHTIFKNEIQIAKTKMLAGQNQGFAHALAFNKSAIGGIQIPDQKISGRIERDFAMRTGNGAVRDADMIAVGAADTVVPVADREGRARRIAANYFQEGHKVGCMEFKESVL